MLYLTANHGPRIGNMVALLTWGCSLKKEPHATNYSLCVVALEPPIIECKLLPSSENANKQSKIRKITKALSEFHHLFQHSK